jgi:MFS family permease
MAEAPPVANPALAATQDDADKIRSEALATTEASLPEGYYRSSRIVGTWIGIGVSLVATYWAFQAGAAVITTIDADIGPSSNVSLFSTVWTVGQPISILIFGRLSDRFGRRNFILAANVLGVIGAIVGATAQSIETLIGANVLLGLASGPPASYPLLTGELMKNEWKFLGTVLVVVPNVIATGFGAYLGQRLIVVANWRWIYYIYIMMIGTNSSDIPLFHC